VPALGVAETKERPAGKASVTATPEAFEGPAFVSVSVKMTFVLIVGVELSTVFVRLRSALETTVVASLAESFEVEMLPPPPDTVAVFVTLFAAVCKTLTLTLIAG
jgi:hypothetical protein